MLLGDVGMPLGLTWCEDPVLARNRVRFRPRHGGARHSALAAWLPHRGVAALFDSQIWHLLPSVICLRSTLKLRKYRIVSSPCHGHRVTIPPSLVQLAAGTAGRATRSTPLELQRKFGNVHGIRPDKNLAGSQSVKTLRHVHIVKKLVIAVPTKASVRSLIVFVCNCILLQCCSSPPEKYFCAARMPA